MPDRRRIGAVAVEEGTTGPFASILSTSLLDDIWTNALDPGYQEATTRRSDPARHPAPSRRLIAVVLTSAVIGTAVAAGATQVRRAVVSGQGTKAALIRQIEAGETTADRLTAEQSSMRAEVATARAQALTRIANGDALTAQLTAAEQASAASPVSGPGATVRLVDGPPVTQDASGDDPARVTDVDLRQVVNALWASGAEAIAVNGFRLGPQTAIRTAGSAVLVDFRPVESPYVVAAVGPSNRLETGYASSPAAALLSTLSSAYGIAVSVDAAKNLQLPGTSGPDLVFASPVANAP
jgi:uncharacterized protein YlxW (UPF0749 family)